MTYNISNNRTFDLLTCEYFENWDYRQIAFCWRIDGKERLLEINLLDHGYEYDALKQMLTCGFLQVSNVKKAEACDVVLDFLVPDLDSKGLFNNPDA